MGTAGFAAGAGFGGGAGFGAGDWATGSGGGGGGGGGGTPMAAAAAGLAADLDEVEAGGFLRTSAGPTLNRGTRSGSSRSNPRVRMNIYTEGKSFSDLGRVHDLNDPTSGSLRTSTRPTLDVLLVLPLLCVSI